MGSVLRTTISLISAVIVFVLATIIVAWVLEDEMYFSLLAGIPFGVVCAALTFASVPLCLKGQRARKMRAEAQNGERRLWNHRHADGSGELK